MILDAVNTICPSCALSPCHMSVVPEFRSPAHTFVSGGGDESQRQHWEIFLLIVIQGGRRPPGQGCPTDPIWLLQLVWLYLFHFLLLLSDSNLLSFYVHYINQHKLSIPHSSNNMCSQSYQESQARTQPALTPLYLFWPQLVIPLKGSDCNTSCVCPHCSNTPVVPDTLTFLWPP